jgi:hypothetical protein
LGEDVKARIEQPRQERHFGGNAIFDLLAEVVLPKVDDEKIRFLPVGEAVMLRLPAAPTIAAIVLSLSLVSASTVKQDAPPATPV